MKLLLDTHALIWLAEDGPQLSRAAAEAVQSPRAEVFCSVASIWEIAIKTALGKLRLGADLETSFQGDLEKNNIRLLSIDYAHAVRVATLPRHHGDPFDRLLVAQSLIERMVLVSHDPRLDAYGVRRLW